MPFLGLRRDTANPICDRLRADGPGPPDPYSGAQARAGRLSVAHAACEYGAGTVESGYGRQMWVTTPSRSRRRRSGYPALARREDMSRFATARRWWDEELRVPRSQPQSEATARRSPATGSSRARGFPTAAVAVSPGVGLASRPHVPATGPRRTEDRQGLLRRRDGLAVRPGKPRGSYLLGLGSERG